MEWKETGGVDFTPAPAGMHPARCIRLIDVGTQFGEYLGKETAARKVVISFELPTELMPDGEFAGKPFIVSKFYTASLGEKANLRRDLISWRGREFSADELAGFDAKNILGKPCMVQVTHTEKGKAKIAAITAVPKGLVVPPQVNETVYFSLERDEFQVNTFDSLGKYYREMIEKSPEWAKLNGPSTPLSKANVVDELESDIPF
jgi:hypothetical protein